MGSSRTSVDAGLRPSKLSRISLIACCLAALFMLVSAAHAIAHDHDDHAADNDSECVICSVASSSGAKLAPDGPRVIEPSHNSDQGPDQNAVTPHLRVAAHQTARGPPSFFLISIT